MNDASERGDGRRTVTASAAAPVVLSARGIHKSYGSRAVLTGVDIDLRRGEHVAIIGPSGSGKSTFIRCLNLLERPEQGSIELLGETVFDSEHPERAMKQRNLRKRVGMVFQAFNLFTTHTALQNVSLAQRRVLGRSKAEADERSRELLTRVGLGGHQDSLPSRLSGGQQQRVAIARALALDPQVMLFDEPTSAIDPEMRSEVLSVMRDLAERGTTMVVVTHELRFAERAADRMMFLADGEVLESGTPSQLLRSPQHARVEQFVRSLEGVGE
ncbi:MAG: amino acid ABC transporter ATP-binding protein [Actinobacteria bacterium]|nr:amino acid ABC transporter ATP-binding protein [Actinomycetota bacterium]